ncbi:hypothetical protein [Flavicella sp.]|uniref:hypothetical protein n=1 Tax=Flavicella sp. TaxID=2957742 RepID=UPI003015965A
MKILKELSRKEFHSKFGEESLCLSFLSWVKWEEGFSCFKCKKEYNKRCSKCGYDKSPTANTIVS